MNDKPESMFADLEDDSEWDGSKPAKPVRHPSPHTEGIGDVAIPGFVEDCPKCNGTGTWLGSYSRYGRKCFKCKGAGKLQFRTSPEARAKARKYAQKRKVRNLEQNRETALANCPNDVADWLKTNEQRNNFAASVLGGMAKYGSITDGQIAGVRKAIAREEDAAAGASEWIAEHEAEHKWLVTESANGNELAEDLLNGKWGLMKRSYLTDNQLALVRRKMETEGSSKSSDIDLSKLELGRAGTAWRSYFAVPDGDTRLKLCIRRPGKSSRYFGWTFVDDGAVYGSRKTYGKQAPDGMYKGDVQDALRAILADPLEASKAYGKLTGTCGVCGRDLEDEDSVAAGIGPICAAKY